MNETCHQNDSFERMELENREVNEEKLYSVGYSRKSKSYVMSIVITWVMWFNRYYRITKEEYDSFGTSTLDKLSETFLREGVNSDRFLDSDMACESPTWKRRRLLRRLVRLALAGVAFVVACNLAVLVAAAGRVTPVGHAAEAPARRAAVVMGCVPKLRGGWDNPYFTARIEAAAELWRAGKVEALVVSGDNHVEWYDEPSEMKKALVAAGVPEDRIVCDYAGFRTLDSVVRAKTIFGLDSFLVVSQDFHVRRAIFLGRCRGLDIRGYAARGVPLGRLSSRTIVREPLARVAAVLDVLLGRRPRFGGPRVPLPQTAPSL